jgi:HemY protein
LLCRVHIERLRGYADQNGGNDDKNDGLAEMWKAIPAEERKDRKLVLEAVPLFARVGKGRVVRRTLEHLLDEQWDTTLARLYGFCGDISERDVKACLEKGEKWLLDHREDPGLLFSLGRLCAESQLWGKAVEYFELSLKWQPEVETHLALANLFKRLGRNEDVQKHYCAAAERVAAG